MFNNISEICIGLCAGFCQGRLLLMPNFVDIVKQNQVNYYQGDPEVLGFLLLIMYLLIF